MQEKANPNVLLKDIAYNKIKEDIIQEVYHPGYILSEKELVNNLDMSKTPIKSAIDRLQAEGFVYVSAKRGVIIQDLSVERINDIYNLRIALEKFNCEQIYKDVSDDILNRLERNLKETKNIIKTLNVKEFSQLDHEFHQIVAEATGNKEILSVLLNYNDHLLRITLKHLNKDPKRMIKFHEDHLDIFRLLKEHDKKCINRMQTHLEESKRMLFVQ